LVDIAAGICVLLLSGVADVDKTGAAVGETAVKKNDESICAKKTDDVMDVVVGAGISVAIVFVQFAARGQEENEKQKLQSRDILHGLLVVV